MKFSSVKFLFLALFFVTSSFRVFAQDDDGIYGDIFQAPELEEELADTTVSPLDGYSTVDDYYNEEEYTPAENNPNQPYSEQYVDESGNNVTNNYYGDYYEDDDDYEYASRINRFHRPMYNYGYYDPYYTNMYYYNNDPFYWGTSIYIGYQSSFFWNRYSLGWWGYGNNPYGFGWNNGFGTPACYGGGGWFGGGGNYWNGYNNGFNDGLVYGGYYNTFDSNSGIYYGHRGSTGNFGSTIGSGYRSTSIATVYNKAAQQGKVLHANKGNVLQTADARPVKGNLAAVHSTALNGVGAKRQSSTTVNRGVSADRARRSVTKESTRAIAPSTRQSAYQRGVTERGSAATQRSASPTVDRSRYRASTAKPRTNSSSTQRGNSYQRGNDATRYSNRQRAAKPSRSTNDQRGNMYRDFQRTQPNSNGYNRNNSNRYKQPSRNATRPPSNYQQPSRNAAPSRNYQQPSRNKRPSRSVSPTPSQNRGSSNGRSVRPSSPSRSSGSVGRSRGSSSTPSRGSSAPARGRRP